MVNIIKQPAFKREDIRKVKVIKLSMCPGPDGDYFLLGGERRELGLLQQLHKPGASCQLGFRSSIQVRREHCE